jgi:hypothetical protein
MFIGLKAVFAVSNCQRWDNTSKCFCFQSKNIKGIGGSVTEKNGNSGQLTFFFFTP